MKLRDAYLEAETSARNAWYHLTLEKISEGYLIRKHSGAKDKMLHTEIYYRAELSEALPRESIRLL